VLGIPRDPVAACEVLAGGNVRSVDAGEVDGETFVGIASIGLESEVTRIANAAPRLGGRAVYAAATLIGLARWRPASFALGLDGAQRRFSGYLVAAANSGRFGGGMRLAPDARLDDGLFDVVVLEHSPRRTFLRNVPKVFAGTHVQNENVQLLHAREVRLDADRPFEVYADGDVVAQTPATARVLPGGLRVLAPAAS
jgi:diacylglycerol kinase family enzyme